MSRRSARQLEKPVGRAAAAGAAVSARGMNDVDEVEEDEAWRQQRQQLQKPKHKQPLRTARAEQVESDEGAGEETRCICGNEDYMGDEEDTGFYLSCDACHVWQHGPCVGIPNDKAAPEVYFCELCRPDLHELVDARGRRSQYRPSKKVVAITVPENEDRRPPDRRMGPRSRATPSGPPPQQMAQPVMPRATSKTQSPELQPPATLPPHSRSHSATSGTGDSVKRGSDVLLSAATAASTAQALQNVKRRSTMNSRDSHYEEILQQVLEESAKEEQDIRARSSSLVKEEDMTGWERVEDDGRRKKRSYEAEERPVGKRQKQTQNVLLEIDERRQKNEMDVEADGTYEGEIEVGDEGEGGADEGKHAVEGEGEGDWPDKEAVRNNSEELDGELAETSERAPSRDLVEHDEKQEESEEPDEEPEQSTTLKPRPGRRRATRRGGRKGPRGRGGGGRGGSTGVVGGRSDYDPRGPSSPNPSLHESRNGAAGGLKKPRRRRDASPDADTNIELDPKPSKPRVPPARASMGEMRKRVAAILEFIGRTQLEMAVESERKELDGSGSSPQPPPQTQMQTVPQTDASERTIATAAAIADAPISAPTSAPTPTPAATPAAGTSVAAMDELTRELLQWEQKYGRYGQRAMT